MSRVVFEVFGAKQVDREIRFMAERAGDAIPLWQSLLKRFYEIEHEQFETEGGHGSGGWAALSEGYPEAKAAAGLRTEILRATDALFESLTGPSADAEVIMEPTFWAFTSHVAYGGYLMRGTNKMPARPPVEFTAEERREWVKRTQWFVVKGELM